MNTGQKVVRFFVWVGLVILQLIMTQVVTFIISLLVPDMGNFPQLYPTLFVVILGITFTAGVFLTGWLALKLHWLKMEQKLVARFVCTVIGAYLPLVAALFLYHPLEAGNPFFFISILLSIAGFYLGGWIGKK